MSESWKNRFWQLVLVCTFAVVLSVCNKAVNSSSEGSNSSGTAFADGSSVTITSLALPTISSVMNCGSYSSSGGVTSFSFCDSTDSTSIDSSKNYSITLENLVTAGFRPCFIAAAGSSSSAGKFFFCK